MDSGLRPIMPRASGVIGRFLDGTALYGSDPGGDADDNARPGGQAAVVHLVDEVAQHLLGYVEVGDDAVTKWPDRLDVGRRASDHPLGFHAHLERAVVAGVDGDDRRLVENDALTAHEHERIRRAQIDCHVAPSD